MFTVWVNFVAQRSQCFLIGSILHAYICQLWKRIHTHTHIYIDVSRHWQFSIDIVVDLGHKVTERLKERQKKFQRQKSIQIDPHLSELPGTYWNKFYKNRESVQLNQWVLTYFTKISSSEFHFKGVFYSTCWHHAWYFFLWM